MNDVSLVVKTHFVLSQSACVYLSRIFLLSFWMMTAGAFYNHKTSSKFCMHIHRPCTENPGNATGVITVWLFVRKTMRSSELSMTSYFEFCVLRVSERSSTTGTAVEIVVLPGPES